MPFTPTDWGHATLALEPGVDGVGVRIGDRIALMFPEAMVVTATEPGAAFPALVSRLTGDPTLALKGPAELAKEQGAVFYRFRTTHLAQPRAQRAPEFLHRCGKMFEQRDMTAGELRRWAGELAGFLAGRASGASYDPVPGREYEETDAGRALAALALVQYSEIPDLAAEQRAAARRGAAELLAGIGAETLGTYCGPAWVALRGLGIEGSPELVQTFTAKGDILRELFATLDTCLTEAPRLEPVRQCIYTWARARRAIEHRAPVEGLDREIRTLFRETPPGELVSLMPWLGWTELTWARIESDGGPGRAIPSAAALRDMRDLVWRHQLRGFDLPWEQRDLAGAIVFTKAAAGQRAMPTWQAARPLAFIATMLGDPRLTDDAEVAAELSRLLQSLRFLRQLTASEADGHMYRSPDRAVGGVRASLFDQRMPPEATSLTLIAVCETIRSLEQIESRRGAAGEAPPDPGARGDGAGG